MSMNCCALHDQPDPLLDAVPEQVGVLHDHLQGSAAGAAAVTPPHDGSRYSGEPELGTWIGRYRLMELIGEGGFGLVYVAEQSEPVRRRVALKVVKPGVDTREVIARFEAERQALALMDHPNIARSVGRGGDGAGATLFLDGTRAG